MRQKNKNCEPPKVFAPPPPPNPKLLPALLPAYRYFNLPIPSLPEYRIGVTLPGLDSLTQCGIVRVIGALNCNPSGRHWIPNAAIISSSFSVMYFVTSVMTDILMSFLCPAVSAFGGISIRIPNFSSSTSPPSFVMWPTRDFKPGQI